MSSLLYPILQALDEEYLGVNVQFGGVDQRKIFMFARNHLPRIGYKNRSYLMNPLVPGLGKPENGKPAKMSSSLPASKIDFDDTNKQIKQKLNKAYSVDGEVENNGVLALAKYVVFRICETQDRPLLIQRKTEHGGDITFASYQELEQCFASGQLASADLKNAIANELCEVITVLRTQILGTHKKLYQDAYPVEKKEVQRQIASTATFQILDVRVGTVLSAEIHPSADTLFVEKIDVGEDEPRTIVSGLRHFYTLEEFVGKQLLVICNLPPKKTRDIMSYGMVYCASNKEHTQVVLLPVPVGSEPGDKVYCEGFEGPPEEGNLNAKRYKRVSDKFLTNENGVPTYEGVVWRTEKGEIPPCSIPNAIVA